METSYSGKIEVEESILKTLEEERIFSIDSENGEMGIVEACDGYFSVVLTKAEFERLIAELQAIYNGL
jgi:hypothetical protein